MFSKGQLIFAVFFLIAFVIAMVWSYKKEKSITQIHFKKSYKILIALVLFFVIQFIIVKIILDIKYSQEQCFLYLINFKEYHEF